MLSITNDTSHCLLLFRRLLLSLSSYILFERVSTFILSHTKHTYEISSLSLFSKLWSWFHYQTWGLLHEDRKYKILKDLVISTFLSINKYIHFSVICVTPFWFWSTWLNLKMRKKVILSVIRFEADFTCRPNDNKQMTLDT